jgi:hypothetical protein
MPIGFGDATTFRQPLPFGSSAKTAPVSALY